MSQNCPVIISKSSALPEINSDAALYFNPDNEVDIKNQMKRIGHLIINLSTAREEFKQNNHIRNLRSRPEKKTNTNEFLCFS